MVYRPTDRERQRYITYSGRDPLPTFRKLFGSFGEATAGIQARGNTIRLNADSVDRMKAAICLTPGSSSIKVTSNITKARKS